LIFCIVLAKNGKVKRIVKNARIAPDGLEMPARRTMCRGWRKAPAAGIDLSLRLRAKASNIELSADLLRNAGYPA
jgi:hypothetical protein